jgi:hypothetical protein
MRSFTLLAAETTTSGRGDSGPDGLSYVGRRFVRPEAQNRPPESQEVSGCFCISALVAFELRLPPIRIGLWSRSMQRTAVPEAAVDENRDPGAREANIDRPAAHPWY